MSLSRLKELAVIEHMFQLVPISPSKVEKSCTKETLVPVVAFGFVTWELTECPLKRPGVWVPGRQNTVRLDPHRHFNTDIKVQGHQGHVGFTDRVHWDHPGMPGEREEEVSGRAWSLCKDSEESQNGKDACWLWFRKHIGSTWD